MKLPFTIESLPIRANFDALAKAVGTASRTRMTDALAAGSGPFGSGLQDPTLTKTSDGIVVLEGLVSRTVALGADGTLLTLPFGNRPPARLVFWQARATGGGTTGTAGRVDVFADGRVCPRDAMAVADWVSLSGMIFRSA